MGPLSGSRQEKRDFFPKYFNLFCFQQLLFLVTLFPTLSLTSYFVHSYVFWSTNMFESVIFPLSDPTTNGLNFSKIIFYTLLVKEDHRVSMKLQNFYLDTKFIFMCLHFCKVSHNTSFLNLVSFIYFFSNVFSTS